MDLYAQQEQARIAQLKAAHDKAMQDIATKKQQQSQVYSQQRSNVDIDQAAQERQLKERMAAAGIMNSGDNASAQMRMITDRSNRFGDIQNNQDSFMNQMNNNELNAGSQFEADKFKVQSEIAQAREAERQRQDAEAFQRQLQLEKQKSSNSTSTIGGNTGDPTAAVWNQFKQIYTTMGPQDTMKWLNERKTSIIGEVGQEEYNRMYQELGNAMTEQLRQQMIQRTQIHNQKPNDWTSYPAFKNPLETSRAYFKSYYDSLK